MNRIRLLVVGAVALAAVVLAGSALAKSMLLPKPVKVIATEYKYKFSSGFARKNQKVVITLKNAGSEVHDLKFIGVAPKSKFIPGGATTKFTVVFKKTGRFQYICTIGEHALKGMRGTFIVKP